MCDTCLFNGWQRLEKRIVVFSGIVVHKLVRKMFGVPESCCVHGSIVVLINYFWFFLPILHGDTTICWHSLHCTVMFLHEKYILIVVIYFNSQKGNISNLFCLNVIINFLARNMSRPVTSFIDDWSCKYYDLSNFYNPL